MLSLTESRLRRKQALDWLTELENRPGPAASVYISPGTLLPEVEKLTASSAVAGELPAGLAEIIAASPTGGVVFRGEHTGDLLVPPFPVTDKHIFLNLYSGPLREVLSRDLTVAVILLRLGMYAIGLFRGERLLASRVGTGNIHSRHRQGGSSARRFERHRDKQIEEFFARVCLQVRDRLDQYMNEIDWLIYGGTEETVLEFRKQCQYLARLDDHVIDRLLNVREPKQASLEATIEDIWSSRVIHWEETRL
ncbi:MAG: Vms1/Ankzf1 family peptidyl-tRNA hydrolase [Chloroflexota bacterium]